MGRFDSEKFYERVYTFARTCQELSTQLSKNSYNAIYTNQLIRASGSIGANYIEALEATSKKDFIYRLRISRKETRESIHWLRLIQDSNTNSNACQNLITEGEEIKRILSSSILTLEKTLD